MKNEENMITNWLDQYGNPETERYVEKNMAIAEKVNSVLIEKGIKKNEFAEMLGKSPFEISRWLTGMHNLTLKSITKMEIALGIDLINIEPIKEIQ